MKILQIVKRPIKKARWTLRRAAGARRYRAEALGAAPMVIGNAMPKSGSHLLSQVLLGLTRIGPFVDPGMPPLTRSEANENLEERQVLARLQELQPGDIGYGYLHARSPYIEALSRDGVAAFFVYRDPRDVLVSHVFFATELYPGHGMHAYYQRLPDMAARLNAAIEGVGEPGFELSSIREKYAHYMGWLDQPAVHSMRFEDLILAQDVALEGLLAHIVARGFDLQMDRDQALAALAGAIAPRKSGTFRRGQPGEWREHFTAENKVRFKSATGDLLQRLGYEQDADW
ncbi:MAG: hypothetical protein DWG76_02030 [Chloroflexi bacterium]|nr:hypothetical protein [Chloroflexota bacterium]